MRRRISVAVLVLGWAVLVAGMAWLRERDLGSAVKIAFVCVAVGAVVAWIGSRAVEGHTRRTASEGFLEVAVRTPDGHPRLGRRWWPAEIRLDPDVRISPLAGPSAAPFVISPTAARVSNDDGSRMRWLPGPLIGATTLVQVVDPDGTVEIAVPSTHVRWLLEHLGLPESGPAAPRPQGHR